MGSMTRREFVVAGGVAASGRLLGAQESRGPLTAGAVIERIKAQVGVPWRTETVDRVVAGDASTPVVGIATTMMATLDVLERASAAGKNFVITHEPTFYLHQDTTADIKDDPTLRFKQDFIREHKMVVFRFHDHWHARKPDGIATGMTEQLGWEKNADPADPRRFTFAGETLLSLSQSMAKKLNARTMRVIGDPNLPVKRVVASWGYASRERAIPVFAGADVDLMIIGETREWELVEYAQDSITAGNRKGLIQIGHVLSEQGGMVFCAQWLKGFVPEVPVEFVAAREPFWSPGAPPRG